MDINSAEDSIQVFIRVRPSREEQSALAFTDSQIKLDKHQFAFDKIFPPTCSQTDIFHHVGNRLLNNVMDGYNSCVFVYGQTGSGKTHTMIGQGNGLMQQSFKELFCRINCLKNAQCFVTCSYFELYNEQLMDLLDPKKQKKLNIRQDVKRGIFVENLTQQTALDSEKLMDVLYTGMRNRHIGQTQMNRESSRSHSVFTISLSCKVEEDGKQVLKTPKLHFVDLAGSQRQKQTQASGERLKEAGNINKSLTTLGMVINALTSEKPRSHIPYRDSKLTCILRDSLGGNSKTIIIATVSKALLSFQQTLSTLNFANRAKMVKVKALINEESLSNNIEVYKDQIRKLKAQIMRLKSLEGRTPIKVISHQFPPKQMGGDFQHHFEQINKKISSISEQLSQGVTSPSLQAMLHNLAKNKISPTNQTMMQAQISSNHEEELSQSSEKDRYNSEFIEYLNSNYQLLSQINTKVNEYLEIKEELRNIAMNKKLAMESMKTPSKFERDQYQELLVRREQEIKQLEEKVQELQSKLNCAILEKKELERSQRLQAAKDNNDGEKYRQEASQLQKLYEQQKLAVQRLKSNLCRQQKQNQQIQARLKQTKQLYLYAEQKYENQKYTTIKLSSKLQNLQEEIVCLKKQISYLKEEKRDLENEVEKYQVLLEDKESRQEELKNQLQEMQETLDFNKKLINDMTKKAAQSNNQFLKVKQQFQNLKTINLERQASKKTLQEHIERQTQQYKCIMQEKMQQLKNLSQRNQKLSKDLAQRNAQLQKERVIKMEEIQRLSQDISSIKQSVHQKESELFKQKNHIQSVTDELTRVKKDKELAEENYQMRIETSKIQYQEIAENLEKYRSETTLYIQQLKKQLQVLDSKCNEVEGEKQNLQKQKQQLSAKLVQAQKKLESVKSLFAQNEQLKRTYKEVVKENYLLKGKYRSHNNEELEKQKNNQLLSKVYFYEEKFNLMSLENQKITQIVNKLKEKEIQTQKKLQYYEERKKLESVQRDQHEQERQTLIQELKEENRELKLKLDNLEGNLSKQGYEQKLKQQKNAQDNTALNKKEDQLRRTLFEALKNWQRFKTEENYSTQNMIDLCGEMIKDNNSQFQTIAKGIRREQKLKSQNHYILKQNIYLRERVKTLQSKELLEQENNQRPRKVVKTD